jgi:pilus assembly protein CpaE
MRSLLVILADPARENWAQLLVATAVPEHPVIIVATPREAAGYMASNAIDPTHVVLDIGSRGRDVLEEIDALAQQCNAGTRVVCVGDTNDISLYREILGRGVLDYLPNPAPVEAVVKALNTPIEPPAAAPAPTPVIATNSDKRVIVFASAASGDGGSTVALNTAYAISQLTNGSTVLVDMDYQYGMVAKNLSLQNQYGIRDLFDHPERGVDATLIKRMVASYGKLHVITAPPELRYLPNVNAEAIKELIATLSPTYNTIILDIPHVWLPWVATAMQQSTHLVLVAQLWLKSVSHAARMMRAFREIGVPAERVTAVINRSGAKFKEAIDTKDFERVCGVSIRYTVANDIKTVVTAEGSAKTIMELQPSEVSVDIDRIAHGLLGLAAPQHAAPEKRNAGLGLLSKFKG